MRKLAFAFGAAALMLLAGVLTAEAMGTGTFGLRTAAKNFSPIDTVACRVAGPVCGWGRTLICRPLRGCWCARCWR
jgi:hypothetical protein